MKGSIFLAALFLTILSQSGCVDGRGTSVTIRYGTALTPVQKKLFNRRLTRWCKRRFIRRVLRKAMKVFMKLGLNDRNKCRIKSVRYSLLKKLRSNCDYIVCNSRSLRRCRRIHARAQKKFIKSYCVLPTGVKKADVVPTPSSSTTPSSSPSPSPSPSPSTSTPKKGGYLYASKGLSAYGNYPPPCASKTGQTCSAYCPTGATELPATAFSCPSGHKCCAAAACQETCDKQCGAGATELKDYYCPSAQKCCQPPSCGSVEGQRCFASSCPGGAEGKPGFKCSTTNSKCCKLRNCEAIGGQSCSTTACPYDVAPLPNFFCKDNGKCCPSPSASPTASGSSTVSPTPTSSASVTATASSSITPTATASATISVSPSTTAAALCGTVDGQQCFKGGYCPAGATKLDERQYSCAAIGGGACCELAECTKVDGQSCEKSSCPYGVAALDNFNCPGSEVCCPKPSASPTPTSSASITPTASSSITPTTSASPSTTAAALCGTVDGQQCFKKGYCPAGATKLEERLYSCAANGGGVCCELPECTKVDGQSCEKSSCPYGVSALDNFNCPGSEVCCPKPSASPTPTSSASSSVTPSPTSSVTPSVTTSTTPSPSTSAAAACASVDGQMCFARGYCPALATKLPESVFTCAVDGGGVCCQLKSCESVNGQTCAASSCPYGVSPLANFNCPGSKVCCPLPAASPTPSITPSSTASVTASVTSSVAPSSAASSTPSTSLTATPTFSVSPSTTAAAACSSGVRQKCFESKYCPTGASLAPASDFTCDAEGGGICCKLQSCTSVSGQSCVVGPCSYGATPLTNYYCSGAHNCCRAPSASSTPSSSATTTPSASPTATSSVSPAPSSSASASAVAKAQPCPDDGSHECKIVCFNGYVHAKQYTCSYGSCCVKPEGYVEALSGSNSSTPHATAKSVPAATPEISPEAAPEATPGSEESAPEASPGEDDYGAFEEGSGDGCEDYGGKCEDACGADMEEDTSAECKEKDKKCCFPMESQKCEGDLLKCILGSQKCNGAFVDDIEGCESGQRCCESEPCVADYEGSCKETCGSGEEEDGSCEIMSGKCCIPK